MTQIVHCKRERERNAKKSKTVEIKKRTGKREECLQVRVYGREYGKEALGRVLSRLLELACDHGNLEIEILIVQVMNMHAINRYYLSAVAVA